MELPEKMELFTIFMKIFPLFSTSTDIGNKLCVTEPL